MSDDRLFMMGKFEALFPADRNYCRNHMWALRLAEGGESPRVRFGFTAYAVRLMQDVYFLEWTVDAGATLRPRQSIGAIESSKAESDLYAPTPGRIVRFNEELLRDPSGINLDKYGAGWLFEMEISDTDHAGADLMSLDAYMTHLESAWAVAQKTIKGQMNEE